MTKVSHHPLVEEDVDLLGLTRRPNEVEDQLWFVVIWSWHEMIVIEASFITGLLRPNPSCQQTSLIGEITSFLSILPASYPEWDRKDQSRNPATNPSRIDSCSAYSVMALMGMQRTNANLTLQVSQKPANWFCSSHVGQT